MILGDAFSAVSHLYGHANGWGWNVGFPPRAGIRGGRVELPSMSHNAHKALRRAACLPSL